MKHGQPHILRLGLVTGLCCHAAKTDLHAVHSPCPSWYEWRSGILLCRWELLAELDHSDQVGNGARYCAALWVCGGFLRAEARQSPP